MENLTPTLISWASILEDSTRAQAEQTATMPFIHPASPNHGALANWVERCAARAAVQKAQATFLAIKSTLAMATAEERDRIFGRNAFARG